MSPLALLGPQRSRATVRPALDAIAAAGPVAAITAGWQEREPDDGDLNAVLGGAAVNLRLHERAERVWQADPDFRQAHRELQADLRLLRRTYDLRLRHLMDAWRDLEQWPANPKVVGPEREAALEAVRTLDRHHLDRVVEMREAFDARVAPADHPGVRRERDEVAALLETSGAVAMAGGHIAVLLNRLRLFNLAPLIAGKPVVAWSAGAMALTDRVVVFHDSPPQGPGHAEAFDVGLGLASDVVLLPHASERLRLDDRGRVGRLARRFKPAACIALDGGQGIAWANDQWSGLDRIDHSLGGARVLGTNGLLRSLAA